MVFNYYDINPGLIGIIILGIITFLFNKGKKKNNSYNGHIVAEGDDIKGKEPQFEQLGPILNSQPPLNFHYDEDLIDYNEDIKLSNKLDNNQFDISNEIEQPTEISPDPPQLVDNRINIQLLLFLKGSSNLKIAFLLKEILDKPIALRNDGRYRG